jgi:hypothetical protein
MVFFENLRIEMLGPSIASGGVMMLTPAPVGQAGIDERLRFIDAAADPSHDFGRHVHHMVVVAKHDVGQLELAAAFDIDLLCAVDHDVGHGLVLDQRFERAEPEHVGDQRVDEFALLDEIELQLALGKQVLDPAAKLCLEHRARHIGCGGDVHVFEHEWLNVGLRGVDRGAVGTPRTGTVRVGFRFAWVEQSIDD